LANEALRKFGGDSLAEIVRNRDGYLESLGSTPSAAMGQPGTAPEFIGNEPEATPDPDGVGHAAL
jgi:hypothetical protein